MAVGGAAADAGVWDRHASTYARQERWESATIAALLRLADPGVDDRVLDVGTGTGLVLRTLAARRPAARPGRVTGVDRSPGMIARVGVLPDGWDVVRADATALPLPDASVDVLTCSYVLHLIDAGTRAAALGEMRRVARPGARIVVATPWSSRRAVRGALDGLAAVAPARLGGLRTLDPVAALRTAGLAPRRGVLVRRGYPSLVVLAVPD